MSHKAPMIRIVDIERREREIDPVRTEEAHGRSEPHAVRCKGEAGLHTKALHERSADELTSSEEGHVGGVEDEADVATQILGRPRLGTGVGLLQAAWPTD
jgi:hypothetical protein